MLTERGITKTDSEDEETNFLKKFHQIFNWVEVADQHSSIIYLIY